MSLIVPPKVLFAGLLCLLVMTACQTSQSQDDAPEDSVPSIDTQRDEIAVSSQVVTSTTTPQPSSTRAISEVAPEPTTPESSTTSVTSQVVPATSVEEATTILTTTSTSPGTTSTTTLVATTTTLASASPTSYSVEISGFMYVPSALTIRVGDSVTWTNRDSAIHTVTFRDSTVMSSAGLQEGGTHMVTFTSPGAFSYVCSPHPSIQGTITVVTE